MNFFGSNWNLFRSILQSIETESLYSNDSRLSMLKKKKRLTSAELEELINLRKKIMSLKLRSAKYFFKWINTYFLPKNIKKDFEQIFLGLEELEKELEKMDPKEISNAFEEEINKKIKTILDNKKYTDEYLKNLEKHAYEKVKVKYPKLKDVDFETFKNEMYNSRIMDEIRDYIKFKRFGIGAAHDLAAFSAIIALIAGLGVLLKKVSKRIKKEKEVKKHEKNRK